MPKRRAKYIRQVIVRIHSENISSTIAFLKEKWEAFSSDVFDFEFAEDAVNQSYRSELVLAKLVGYSTFIAIFIAYSGLFGLAMFLTERRIKEIAIRKVFGASIPKIFLLLSKELVILVVIANIASWPIVTYSMKRWLQDFSYLVDMSLWVVFVVCVVSFIIALANISFHTVKVAVVNASNALRYE